MSWSARPGAHEPERRRPAGWTATGPVAIRPQPRGTMDVTKAKALP